MPQYLVNGTDSPPKRRKCIACGHMNAPHALACDFCLTVLTGSEWVNDAPASVSDDHFGIQPADYQPTSRLRNRPVEARVRRVHEEYADVVDSDYINERADYGMSPADIEALSASGADLRETIQVVNRATQRVPRRGTPVFESTMLLSLEVSRDESPVVLRLPANRPLIFGRDDPDSGQRPDIDLVPYGAYQRGVSRHHAALELTGKRLVLSDLSSANGTFLNGVRLDPHETHQIRDGDRLRMGNLTVDVFFNY